MVREVMDALSPAPGSVYIDGTVGGGGHAWEILRTSSPDGRLIGLDLDPEAILYCQKRLEPFFKGRFVLKEVNYTHMDLVVKELGIDSVAGILLDLGASYHQLTTGRKGFSFQNPGPLDMRFSPTHELTAAEIVNHWSEEDLRRIIYIFGQERWASRIARAIVKKRPLYTTCELADVIRSAYPRQRGRSRIDPATRTFQALRIVVNHELENLRLGIVRGLELLRSGGRLCIIAYHSLEERTIKATVKEIASRLRISIKGPIRPSREEIRDNPSARSARLRVLERKDPYGWKG